MSEPISEPVLVPAAKVAAWLTERVGRRYPRHAVLRLAKASEYGRRIKAGEISKDDVPRTYQFYLDAGFPEARDLAGVRDKLFDLDEIRAWYETQLNKREIR